MMWSAWWLACAQPTAPVPGIQIGEEGDTLPCRVITEVVLDPALPQGTLPFPAQRLLDALPASVGGTFRFADGAKDPVVSEVQVTGPVRWGRHAPLYADAGGMCTDQWYEASVRWRLSAGLLDLWVEAEARAWSPDGPVLFARVPGAAGAPLAPERLIAPRVLLSLAARATDDGWDGAVTWEGFDDGSLIDVEPLGTWSED